MDVYKDIVEWSEKLPLWQRDALRRLFQNGECTEKDIEELIYLCRKQSGISHVDDEELNIECEPLKSKHVPSSPDDVTAVSLTSIGGFVNVNRLSSEARLSLPETGLIVVFGDNGAGKSGYIRVLKQVCRARGNSGVVHTNAYIDDDTEQSAVIEYVVDGEQFEYEWSPDDESIDELSIINVFDSDSAQVHISNKNELQYQPFGLDLISRLAEVVTRVSTDLRSELEDIKRQKDDFDDFEPETKVADFLSGITKKTTIAEIGSVTTFTVADETQLKGFHKQLADIQSKDPTEEIRKLSLRKRTLEVMVEGMSELPVTFPDVDIKAGMVHRQSHLGFEEAANKVATQFDDLEMDGVGEEAWKTLWSAAKRYSESLAYPEQHFPNLDGKCVLCHQDLDKEAQERFTQFQNFIQDDTQQRLRESEHAANRREYQYGNGRIKSVRIQRGLDLLEEIAPDLYKKCEAFLSHYEIKRNTLINVWKQNITAVESAAPVSLEKDIEAEVKKIDVAVVDLEKQLKGLVSAEKVQEKIDELDARKQAKAAKKRIEEEVERLQLEEYYEAAVKTVGTLSITKKSKELATVVTETLAEQFVLETKKLQVNNDVDVALEVSEASYGVTYNKIVSPSADPNVPLVDILSEGEQRAIAIAAFMNEVNSLPGSSGVIFDDPVTSLDHDRKEAIANRLAEEAKKRQVVVFTHDLPFVFDLRNAAEVLKITPAFRTMQVHTGTKETGNIVEELPWHGQKTKARINVLREKLRSAIASYEAGETEMYDMKILDVYVKLRQTWESVVENVLFHEVVTRFNKDIKTQQLRYVYDNVSEADCSAIDEGMTKCSTFMHEAATAKVPSRPKPDEIEQDIVNIESLVNDLNAKQKGR